MIFGSQIKLLLEHFPTDSSSSSHICTGNKFSVLTLAFPNSNSPWEFAALLYMDHFNESS